MAGQSGGVPGLSEAPSGRDASSGATPPLTSPLILASASPRRAAALSATGHAWRSDPADVDESPMPGEAPRETAQRLARAKAICVAGRHAHGLVLGGDTIVDLDGRALGKPADRAAAEALLADLSGRSHQVHTALALVDAADGRCFDGVASAEVAFAPLDAAARADCLAGDSWRDKAGGYALQERAGLYARVTRGDADTVIGFPRRLFEELLLRWAGRSAALLLLALLAACGGTEHDTRSHRPARPARLELSVAGRSVTVELAVSESERNRGLMHRTSLAADAGMLFVFPDDRPRTFWMQNTLIPLDIVFLDADGTVQNIERGLPGVERPGYSSRRPARMVLELNAGWSEEHGLAPGAVIAVPPEIVALSID